jgi:signal transduction histidine kinase
LGSSFRSSARYASLLLGLASVYFGAAKLGFTMAFVAEQVTIVWPPTGIALAAVLQLGYRVWPAIWLGAFLANVTANEPVVAAGGVAIGNTLEALAGVWLLRRVVGPTWDPERLKHVVGLIVLAALGSTTVSATIGTTSLVLGAVQPWRAFRDIWWVWWAGDAISNIIIAPLLLAWVICRWRPLASRVIEGICLLALVVVATVIVFIGSFELISRLYLLVYVVFPFVIWGALRFGQQGTTTVTFVASTVAIVGALRGSGPFATGNPHEGLILLQLFMGTVAVSGLLLAAAVAERSRVEDALRRAHEELRNANRAKDESLATLGHELRTPLATITNAIAVLQSGAADNRAVELHSIIGRQAAQLSRLADDLLDVARVTTGKTSLERQPFDLREAAAQCLAGLHQTGRTEHHRIVFHGMSAVVEGDRVRLDQVISNLLNNALKYTPPGGSIRVAVQVEAGQAVLRVQDTGIGIPRQLLPRIFDLFMQAREGPGGPQGGLGLGLTLVRHLVELHGGTVTAHSDGAGKGSEFVVRLPLATLDHGALPTTSNA